MAVAVTNVFRMSSNSGVIFNSSRWLGLTSSFPASQRFISGKTMRGSLNVDKPAPFPYKTKKYRYYHLHLDSTRKRFDDNTKIVVVEGNVAAGKTTLAKVLAEEFELLFIPEANMDLEYKNQYGYDMRDYKHLVPEAVKPFDLADFYANPTDMNVAAFQMRMYKHRYFQYIDALEHLFHTGQGVVMDRCVYSDFCFVEAMVKHGYMGVGAKKYYYKIRDNSIVGLMKPHLIVYLDVPVDVLQERIKRRGNDYEQKTSVLSTSYLQTLADVYKNEYLKEIGKHAELLIYDWSKFGDAEVVMEDIERIDLDRFNKYDTKMADWRLDDEQEFSDKRWLYSRQKAILHSFLNVPIFDVPEMYADGPDMAIYDEVWRSIPGNKYAPGFNEDMGEKNTLFKM